MGAYYGNEEPIKTPKNDNEIYAGGTKRTPLIDYYVASKALGKIIIKENKQKSTEFFFLKK